MPKSFRIQSNSRFDKKAVLWDAVNGGEPPVPPPPPFEGLCFTAEQASSTVSLSQIGTLTPWSIEISTDGSEWSSYTMPTPITLSNIGDKVYFRGPSTNAIQQTDSKHHKFNITGKVGASGSIMSLMGNAAELTAIGQFAYLFENTPLTSPPELPATTLTAQCYKNMFNGCASLSTAPSLPATGLSGYCYHSMFQGCTSLVEAPELPASTLSNRCYQYMFNGCSKLTKMKIAYTGEFTASSTGYTYNWLKGVPLRGAFYYNGENPLRSIHGIPSGWTITPF